MKFFNRLEARLRPVHLYHQVFLLAAGIIVVGAVITTILVTERITTTMYRGLEQQALALSRSTGSAITPHLILRDFTALEAMLIDIARFPGIEHIWVKDKSGRDVGRIRKEKDGTPRAYFTTPSPLAPTTGLPQVYTVESEQGRRIVAWYPVGNEGELGVVGIAFSTQAERDAVYQTQKASLLSALAIVVVMATLLHLFLRRALRPLHTAAAFATRLSRDYGVQLSHTAGSAEVDEMTSALNEASTQLARQYAEIVEHESRVSAILETNPDVIIGLDAGANILFINNTVDRIFGLSPQILVGKPLATLVPSLSAIRVQELVQAGILMGGTTRRTARFETTATRNGGVEFAVEVFCGEVSGNASLRYACMLRDVTQQKEAEESLRLFSRALDCSGNGVVISDVRLLDQPVVYINAAFSNISGYAVDEVIGRNCRFLQGTDREDPDTRAARQEIRTAMDEGRSTVVTLQNYRKNGSSFWNELTVSPVRDAKGTITHFVGVQTDVTQRIQSELTLAEHGARLNAIFALSPDGFMVFDQDGKLVYVNPALYSLTGIDLDIFDSSVDLASFEKALAQCCDSNQPYVSVAASETRLLAEGQDGEQGEDKGELIYLTMPAPRILERRIRRGGRAGQTLVLYFRDITRETEVDRMKSEFLSTAAHELRTPMASIFGFSELLLRRQYDEKTRRDLLETIHRQSGLLINLLNELLDLARIEARAGKDFKIRVQPLAPIIEDTVAALLVKDDPRIVSVNLPEAHVLVRVDAEKLRQAVTNLLSNAYKYSPKGGEIELDCVVNDNHKVIGIRIRDHGIGMTPEQLARAFERFYRADSSGNIPGTGLGLCLVKEIVELQGGKIDMESTFGQGTTVTVWLPLPDAALAAA